MFVLGRTGQGRAGQDGTGLLGRLDPTLGLQVNTRVEKVHNFHMDNTSAAQSWTTQLIGRVYGVCVCVCVNVCV